jgi:hypothetical protein
MITYAPGGPLLLGACRLLPASLPAMWARPGVVCRLVEPPAVMQRAALHQVVQRAVILSMH